MLSNEKSLPSLKFNFQLASFLIEHTWKSEESKKSYGRRSKKHRLQSLRVTQNQGQSSYLLRLVPADADCLLSATKLHCFAIIVGKATEHVWATTWT
jgi:hypothetical protein